MTILPPGRLAVLADIHGNADALSAVLADIDSQGAGTILNLGDHFSGPLAAAETWEILAARPMISIRGNHDRWLVEQTPEEMGTWESHAFRDLPAAALDWLRSLPATADLGAAFLCHATPADDLTYWTETVGADGTVALRDQPEIEALAEELAQPLLLCGHTHVPRALALSGGRLLVNPGSVGCPAYDDDLPVPHRVETAGPQARYALLDPGAAGWTVTHRAVPYDPSRMIDLARARGQTGWAQALATGRIA